MTKPQGHRLVNSKARLALSALLVLAIPVALYAATFGEGAFVLDDKPNISENAAVTGFDSADPAAWKAAAFDSPARLRVLSNLSFAIQWELVGHDPRSFRLVNAALHGLAALVLLWVLVELLALHLPGKKEHERRLLAAAGALLWALHPVQTQAVDYIVQRMSVMAGLFVFLSAALYFRARRKGGAVLYGASLPAFLAALFSKESAATLPVVLMLYEWLLAPEESPRARRLRWTALALACLPPLAVALAYAAISGQHFSAGALPNREFTLVERMLSAARMYWAYLGVLLWPEGLAPDHAVSPSRGLFTPARTFWAWLGLLGVVAAAVLGRKRVPALSFAALGFIAVLGPETTFLNLELFVEHRLYVASAFVIPLVPLGLDRAFSGRAPVAVPAVAGVLLVVLGTLTALQNRHWRSAPAILTRNVEVEPANGRAHYNLGQEYGRRGEWVRAVEHYERAEALGVDEAPFAIGFAAHHLGRWSDSLAAFRRALEVHPRKGEALFNLGLTYRRVGDYEKAVHYYREAIEHDPDNRQVRLNLALALLYLKRPGDAEAVLDETIARWPDEGQAHYLRMGARIRQDEMDAARRDWERAMELGVPEAKKYEKLFSDEKDGGPGEPLRQSPDAAP